MARKKSTNNKPLQKKETSQTQIYSHPHSKWDRICNTEDCRSQL